MLCNKRQLADIIGYTEATITKWQKEGLPFEVKRGRENSYDTKKVIAWLMKKGDRKNGGLDGEQERARKDKAMADKYELELAVRKGELLESEDVKKTWVDALRLVRSRMLGLPTKLAPIIVMQSEPQKAQAILKEEIHSALKELANEKSR